MTTYARVVDGFAIDVYHAGSAQELEQRLGVTGFVVVPDGTVSGSKQNGQGGFDAPVERASTPVPKSISNLDFITLCQESGGMTDDMLVACKADARFAAMWIKFDEDGGHVDNLDARIQNGLIALAAAGYLPNGADAVNSAWPKQ